MAKQKKPAAVAELLKDMPDVKSWREIRTFLHAQGASEDKFVAARGLWRKFKDSGSS